MPDTVQIRRITPPDIPQMAQLASTAYFHTPLSQFLSPHRHTYPADFTRRFAQSMRARYYNPRCIGFVAVSASDPGTPVGYAQFIRLGEDKAARDLIAAQSSIWNTLRRWWVTVRTWIETLVRPDRSVDADAVAEFEKAVEEDNVRFWESAEMKRLYGERWHAQSVVVSADWRRRGIGRRLMGEAMRRAQEEGVVVGLEASGDGEQLYRSLGFELRGRFCMILGSEDGNVGGIMMWRPTGEVD
ncbi:acyl-CoA N-acyltransferase [Aspergillus pseudonomiae]|uniref:Acyl-CoA N-acyltransferase n=1 Tax=Aspergillus pseudonomiae TaxID=1506151 RepID=A0A5N7CV92_9EURO|nr:acyl-CoA N-acyltransferase [Aspergillus pseudonomiae]KAB8261553.1 acyl-CoA N-acyltransferase [Aspergillus pseudonomiae]KAE8398110.1 acyl-CoA N-acyltransferase [Aspergillus pseudonomiae]